MRISAKNGTRRVNAPTGNIVVAGGSVDELNGVYIPSGIVNGKTSYVLTDGDVQEVLWNSMASPPAWQIRDDAEVRFEGIQDVLTPDLVETWTRDAAIPPTPTVTAETEVISVPHLNFSTKSS